MSSPYSVERKSKKISRNALVSLIIGLVCLFGYFLLLLASVLSIGNVGVAGGFLGSLFLLLSAFGALWGILWYDEARTLHKFKRFGIIVNIIALCLGLILIVI